ncbi:RNA polymerase sigma factor [Chryseolinea lacunae]|uniref:Sigma-70 family RNA polymerase sigma factor n=1 Tax=Chryseolinea lacunae TaxID=2801331 RepID=A0ABS1KPQ5_9BACT|nr:sigma-70 family RNA polymerase sigma factor [Chryseolinea lacunae]MBL0741305.1 sigma-70 family RNA polymerase sigma factor [Chryseolinea lacunae]
MASSNPEHLIIDRILAGEAGAYAELVNKHKSYAFTLAMKILQNRGEAEEAAQDAFIKAYHHLNTFNRDAKFSTWLYRIVFNTAISYKRKHRQTFQSIEHTVLEYSPDAEGSLERMDKRKYLALAMAKLNEADRTALTLFYLNEFSLEEIADITGLEANTAKVRIHRARLRLADELKLILNQEALTL